MVEIRTERLTLRPLTLDDADEYARVFAIPEVMLYPLGRGYTREEADRSLAKIVAHWEENGFGLFGARLLGENDRFIGYIGLATPSFLPEVMPAVEVGWRLDPHAWNRGIATEGARASLRYAFDDLSLDRIISIYEPANVASGRVMQKLGMRLERATVYPGTEKPLHVYEITRAAWTG